MHKICRTQQFAQSKLKYKYDAKRSLNLRWGVVV